MELREEKPFSVAKPINTMQDGEPIKRGRGQTWLVDGGEGRNADDVWFRPRHRRRPRHLLQNTSKVERTRTRVAWGHCIPDMLHSLLAKTVLSGQTLVT